MQHAGYRAGMTGKIAEPIVVIRHFVHWVASLLNRFASAAGSADAVDDENERDGVEHPARMTTARRPKVAESTEQVGAADQQARRQPRLLLERVRRDDQGEAAGEPVERAE